MARSWPALSRASDRKLSRRLASTCMTSLRTSESRASAGSMIEDGSGPDAGRDAAWAVSVEVMVVARCCSALPTSIGSVAGAGCVGSERASTSPVTPVLAVGRGLRQLGQRGNGVFGCIERAERLVARLGGARQCGELAGDQCKAGGFNGIDPARDGRKLGTRGNFRSRGYGGLDSGSCAAGSAAGAGCSTAPVSTALVEISGSESSLQRGARTGLARQAPGEGFLVEYRYFDGVRHQARRGNALDGNDDVVYASVDHQACEADGEMARTGVQACQRILRGVHHGGGIGAPQRFEIGHRLAAHLDVDQLRDRLHERRTGTAGMS